jgi:hypothetical protein
MLILIIQQVNKTFQAKHPRLKAYRDEVWRLKDSFDNFCISYIPRAKNQLADSLAVSASMFIPPMPPRLVYEVQMKYRPSLPDNVQHWKVFEDDDEVNRFLQVIDEFSEMQIDQENEALEESPQSQLRNKIGKDSIVQLPSNHIPKGLIPLERLFDQNDVPYKAAQKEDQSAVCKHDIGSPGQPRYINLSTHLSADQSAVVHPDDQEKTAFTTPWGTFMYSKMPFGLMNAGATFQRAMDIAFVGEKDKFVLIYLDDITVYSSSHQDHLQHLKKVFLKCRRFGISVNPKKSQFALEEGKLLGHVVSAAGVKIDPERVKAIQTLSVPRSKKDIQSFLGKINFVRRFIPNFAELVKHITSMLKKGSEIKWTDAARRSFEAIKKAIMEAPTLISPDYSKEFHIFSFASEDTLAAVLLQKDEEGSEHPVAFFSKTLRDAELRYDIIEKQAYALIKSLKAFRIYILHSKVIAYVPSASIKDVLTQPDVDGRRAKWIAKLIEFNIELKPTKLVRGQGLAKLMAE